MDYADECQNIWNDKQDRLEEIAMNEEEALEELLSDDHLIGELIADYDLYPELGNAVRAYNMVPHCKDWTHPSILFFNKLLKSARHKVEKNNEDRPVSCPRGTDGRTTMWRRGGKGTN